MRSQLRPESPRSCVFCGRRPLTREHIFPFWLRDAVGGVGVATNYMTDGGEAWPSVGEPLTYQRQWRANEAGIVARCVCGECNSGWMNDLDHGVKERLVPLVGGAAEELDAGARQRLATWAAKIGILLENTRGVSDLTRRRALIPPKRQRELFELRLPPSCSQIWLAQVRPLVPGAWWRTSPVPLAAFDVEAARFYGAPNASLTTFAIGAIAFQLLFAPMTTCFVDLARRRTERGEAFMRYLWPPNGKFDWPPPKALERDTLEFISR